MKLSDDYKAVRQGTPERELPAEMGGRQRLWSDIAERRNKNAEFQERLINGLGNTWSENRSFG